MSQGRVAPRSTPLRRRLYLLAAAAILPLALMSGASLWLLLQQQRTQSERATQELARSLMIAVDAELGSSISALQVLASTRLPDEDPAAFAQRAERVLAGQSRWAALILHDPTGRVVFNSGFPGTTAQPPLAEPESFREVLSTHQPVVGRIARGPRGLFALPVRVPVLRDGELRYVLTAVVKPEVVTQVLQRQRTPDDWVISVFDSEGVRVGRSRAAERYLGSAASSTLRELMAGDRPEGSGITLTMEGVEAYTAFSRSPRTRWSVVIGVPPTTVNAGMHRSLIAYGGGLVLSLLIGLLAALVMGRGILRAMTDLRQAAQALGRGQVPTPQGSNIHEVQTVCDALVAAAAQQQAGVVERTRLYAEAQAARQHAEGANRAKDEFLAMLGHELRNPLAPIVTALRLMTLRNPQAHQTERRILERQVAHLTRLVDDLLDVSRFARGKVQIRRELIDVRDVVGRAIELVQPLLDQRVVPLEVNLPPQPLYVSGDAVRLAQVLSNLLSNAAKFTPGHARITIGARADGDVAELWVEDAGAGISPQLLPRVFDLFVQGQQTLDRQAGGLGLGLAIVKTLVELHGGTVAASSEGEGHGSRFTVRLPRATSIAVVAGAKPPPPPAHMAGRRILVVDDNLDAAETLVQLLQGAGYEVRSAGSGEETLAVLSQFVPDLAILDIGLPGMDGYELARRLRADVRCADLRLAALTGYGHDLDRSRALSAGFDEHLVKPVPPDQLEAAIDRLLSATSEGR